MPSNRARLRKVEQGQRGAGTCAKLYSWGKTGGSGQIHAVAQQGFAYPHLAHCLAQGEQILPAGAGTKFVQGMALQLVMQHGNLLLRTDIAQVEFEERNQA